jgi:hypothetical protein
VQTITDLYFNYQSATRHGPGCSREGSDVWEVTRLTREAFGSLPEKNTFRFFCGECGHARFVTFEGDLTYESTHASQIGFGSKPERVMGLWLHPGPRFWAGEGHGPYEFYVTRTKDRPRVAADVTGAVGWRLGPRGGIRWNASVGLTDRGNAVTAAPSDFGSRRAAVAWIAAQPEVARP